MIPSPSIAPRLHSLYTRLAESFHRQVTPTPTAFASQPDEVRRLDTTAFAPVADTSLDGDLQALFDRLDADPAVQQALQEHQGPDGFDLSGFLRSGAAGAIDFAGTFGLRSVAAGAFARNPWVQSLSWFLAAAATAPLSVVSRQLTGAPPAADRPGLLNDVLPSAVFLGVNLLHLYGSHTKYPGGTLAGVAQALGLSALTGLAVVAAKRATGVDGGADNGVRKEPQAISKAMLQRALLVAPVAAMSLYVFSRSRCGLPLRTVDRLGPLLLLSVVWCLRNPRSMARR